MNSRLIGYDQNLEMDYQIAAERFCSIANKQVIPLFESLELELNEKDIKAAVTSRQTAKDLYSAIIGETTPKKDKGILRRLLLNTASSESLSSGTLSRKPSAQDANNATVARINNIFFFIFRKYNICNIFI